MPKMVMLVRLARLENLVMLVRLVMSARLIMFYVWRMLLMSTLTLTKVKGKKNLKN